MNETMQDIGVVTAVNGGKVTVEIKKGGECKSCSLKGLCGSNVSSVVLQFETDKELKVGDKVLVGVSSGTKILSSLLVFGLPLFMMFGFYLLGTMFLSDSGAILFGFAGLILAFVIIRIIDRRIGSKINFELGDKYEDMP